MASCSKVPSSKSDRNRASTDNNQDNNTATQIMQGAMLANCNDDPKAMGKTLQTMMKNINGSAHSP